jgi:hypothetical protein
LLRFLGFYEQVTSGFGKYRSSEASQPLSHFNWVSGAFKKAVALRAALLSSIISQKGISEKDEQTTIPVILARDVHLAQTCAMPRILTLKPSGVIAFVAVFGCEAISAQVIDANRPGFSFTTGVVPNGRWQLETGIAYARPGDSGSRTTSAPLAEIRLGVADDIEIFVSSINWLQSESANSESSGLVDAIIGTKIAVGGGEKLRSAVLFQLSAPIGKSDFSSDAWDPSAAYVWAYDSHIPLAGTVKVSYFGDRFQLDNGLQLPFAISDRQSAFVEWEANLPEGGSDSHWLNGGFLWLLDDRRQIDFEAGAGLNKAAGDYRLSAGFSVLF